MFCFTYGDGLADIDIAALIDFHRGTPYCNDDLGAAAGRFGSLNISSGNKSFWFNLQRKAAGRWHRSMAAFSFCRRKMDTTLRTMPPTGNATAGAAGEGNLSAYLHPGFWHPMDTLRDKLDLEDLGAQARRHGRCGDELDTASASC